MNDKAVKQNKWIDLIIMANAPTLSWFQLLVSCTFSFLILSSIHMDFLTSTQISIASQHENLYYNSYILKFLRKFPIAICHFNFPYIELELVKLDDKKFKIKNDFSDVQTHNLLIIS